MIIVDNYNKLDQFLDRFAEGFLDLMVIEGRAGISKSYSIRDKLKTVKHLAINSHVTPLENYRQLFEHRDLPVWYDDCSLLLMNRLQISLLKQVSDTNTKKIISYFTTSDAIGDVPEKFETTSRVLISCNKINGEKDNAHVQAILDRAFHIKFEPSREELLKKMEEVSNNYKGSLEENEKQEVLSFIKKHSINIRYLSLRLLIKGFKLYEYFKLKGISWQDDLLRELRISEKMVLMNELLSKDLSDKERLKVWEQRWSRASFYNYKPLYHQQ